MAQKTKGILSNISGKVSTSCEVVRVSFTSYIRAARSIASQVNLSEGEKVTKGFRICALSQKCSD